MQKGVISVLLYLLVIIISIVLLSYGESIIGLIWVIIAVIIFIISFIITNVMVKDKLTLHHMIDPGNIEHIVMSIFLLIFLFIGRIIWFISPEIGTFLITQNPSYAAIALPMSSFAFGNIFAYSRFQVSSDESTE